jgi:RHS repeat-associated protein
MCQPFFQKNGLIISFARHEQRDYTGSSTERRFFGQGEQILGTNYFFARDHLGSIREMTDTNNTVQARYEYDPYGRRTKLSGDVEADFGFTGHYYHRPSALHLAPFRVYDSAMGRWMSRDPIEERDGVNLYAYVSSDPANWVDPDGLTKVKVNGEIWYTPIQGDRTHVHLHGGVDQGRHMHGPSGKKFFPRTNMTLDKYGNWESAPKQFVKRMEAAVWAKLKVLLRSLGALALFAALTSDGEAAAARIVETMQTVGQDCRSGEDDWAYVGLLTIRHELNQQALGSGDLAMRGALREMYK